MLNEACYNFFLFSFLPIFPLDKNCVFTLEIFIAKLKKCNILTKHFYTDSIKCNNCFATLQLSCSKGYVCIYTCNVEKVNFDINEKKCTSIQYFMQNLGSTQVY